MGIEKRKERRISVELPIRIAFENNPEIRDTTGNISRLGAYVEIGSEIPVGTDVAVTLEIPFYAKDPLLSGEVKCKGNIFRSDVVKEISSKKYYGIGIFFTDFSTQFDKDKLSKYVDFLIVKEEQGLQAGIKRWKEKRGIVHTAKQAKSQEPQKPEHDEEVLGLLKQILTRIEEVSRLLKSQEKTK
jgi:hypothetical protein